MSSSELNRAFWDRQSDEYQEKHREFIGRSEPRWGMYQRPESDLQVLGDVAGKDVLELGCGAAQWAILLARQGARMVGLDNSARQLEHARERMEAAGVDFPLIHSAAESLPFADASFDVVFCDHGALSFADPLVVVPEVARVLRPGGLLAFSTGTPFVWVCWNEEADRAEPRLVLDYFGMHREEGSDGAVYFQLTYGEWVRLFRRRGFTIEDLIEIQPPAGAESTYRTPEDTEWARRWPVEQIWKARKWS
ncbi:MAG TPA: class I SAM-dependent methyltransferase [Gaiellaceae bacterium]|nr:class I SAM-dependent methyltransferase [Gaiellaceae bacterium]